jgi:amidophosphoribosyltransferase
MSIEEIAKHIGVDSLGYLSIEGVRNLAKEAECSFCDGCFTGNYPSEVPKSFAKDKFESKIK